MNKEDIFGFGMLFLLISAFLVFLGFCVWKDGEWRNDIRDKCWSGAPLSENTVKMCDKMQYPYKRQEGVRQ